MIIILLLIALCFIVYKLYFVENFSNGALIQMYAKGPEDSYLTSNTDKYVPEYYIGLLPWKYYLWNEPARFNKYFAQPYGMFPYYNGYPLYA